MPPPSQVREILPGVVSRGDFLRILNLLELSLGDLSLHSYIAAQYRGWLTRQLQETGLRLELLPQDLEKLDQLYQDKRWKAVRESSPDLHHRHLLRAITLSPRARKGSRRSRPHRREKSSMETNASKSSRRTTGKSSKSRSGN